MLSAVVLAGCASKSAVTTTAPPPVPPPTVGSTDPYQASVGYVACMREHGIALPDPKPNGDLDLTEEDEERIGPHGKKNEAADKACFKYLRNAVKTKPLSAAAQVRMVKAMQPFIRVLPLTALIDAMRIITNEGQSVAAVVPQIAIMTAWAVVSFALALKMFRWQ